MKTVLLFVSLAASTLAFAQVTDYPTASKVSFSDYMNLAKEVEKYREDRLVSMADFHKMAADSNTIILDTRSEAMYNAKHLKGAVHLDFTDFNVLTLMQLIPSKETRILIYCNNNFIDDEVFFPSKMASPRDLFSSPVMLALNIPTFINLYGYGYTNIYELGEGVIVFPETEHTLFEGTAVRQPIQSSGD